MKSFYLKRLSQKGSHGCLIRPGRTNHQMGSIRRGPFLLTAMMIHICNILGRFTNFVIPGSYEIFKLIMVIPVGFALAHAALNRYHVTVDVLVSRFPPRLSVSAEILASALSFAIWGLMVYAASVLASETGMQELTETLEIPYLPFRIIWIFCLFLFSLTYLIDLSRAVRRFLNK